jgi:hypothetical protein
MAVLTTVDDSVVLVRFGSSLTVAICSQRRPVCLRQRKTPGMDTQRSGVGRRELI